MNGYRNHPSVIVMSISIAYILLVCVFSYFLLSVDAFVRSASVAVLCVQGKKVVVFYGSQTGTAEEFANRLAKDARRHGMPALAFDPEECTDWVRRDASNFCFCVHKS